MDMRKLTRREFCKALAFAPLAASLGAEPRPDNERTFKLRYIIGSSMYGRMKLSEILPEVRKAGADYIDIWPESHANQREQVEEMGNQQFAAMLKQHRVKLGILTRYDLGPFDLKDEIRVAKKLGGSMVVCGSRGPGNLKGDALKAAVKKFIEKAKPQIDAAEQAG
ncbi:MAG: hypothetical protein WBC22_00705, partial [Sedimentisphaerales bacterium]